MHWCDFVGLPLFGFGFVILQRGCLVCVFGVGFGWVAFGWCDTALVAL